MLLTALRWPDRIARKFYVGCSLICGRCRAHQHNSSHSCSVCPRKVLRRVVFCSFFIPYFVHYKRAISVLFVQLPLQVGLACFHTNGIGGSIGHPNFRNGNLFTTLGHVPTFKVQSTPSTPLVSGLYVVAASQSVEHGYRASEPAFRQPRGLDLRPRSAVCTVLISDLTSWRIGIYLLPMTSQVCSPNLSTKLSIEILTQKISDQLLFICCRLQGLGQFCAQACRFNSGSWRSAVATPRKRANPK